MNENDKTQMLNDYRLLCEHLKQANILAAKLALYLLPGETQPPLRGKSFKNHKADPDQLARVISKRMKVAFRQPKKK